MLWGAFRVKDGETVNDPFRCPTDPGRIEWAGEM
jgi:hypothetical protein